MNVTSNGYYSTNYLDNRRKKHDRKPSRRTINDIFVKDAEDLEDDRDTTDAKEENKGFSGLFSRRSNKGVPYTSKRIRVSSSGNSESVGEEVSSNGKSSNTNSEYLSEPTHDPDYLEEEITPAELNFLSKYRSQGKKKKKYLPDGVFESNGFSGYYINQKKRNDVTPMEMKNYTHKTFKEVFEDKDKSDRYNPVEYVFNNEKEGTLRNRLKALNLKLGRDSYKNYDYYENLSSNSPQSENSSIHDIMEVGTVKSSSKGPGSIMVEPTIIEPDEEREQEVKEQQQPNYNDYSIWNFIASFLTYTSVAEDDKSTNETMSLSDSKALIKQDSIDSIPEVKGSVKGLNVLKKNYKGMASRWNQPVFTIWKEIEPQQVDTPYVREEFVIELDDERSDQEIHEELYYDPKTGQLVKSLPEQRREPLNPEGGVLSHFCQLIKTIKVMKLIFTPIDIIGEAFPNLQTLVIVTELIIFLWILYEISLLIDALCMMIKAFCAPMIALGRFMNRII